MHNPLENEILKAIHEKRKKDPNDFKKVENRRGSIPSPFNTIVRGNVINVLQEFHAKRSPKSRAVDESFNAPVTHEEEEWLAKPNRLDFPGIDTIPGDKLKAKGKTVIDQLMKKRLLHEYTEGKYKLRMGVMGAFYPHGKKHRKKKKTTSGLTVYDHIISGYPEIHISKQNQGRKKERQAHTISHEAGHAIDWNLDPNTNYQHSRRMKAMYKDQMKHVSGLMRGNVDKSSMKSYREDHAELMADVFASFIMQPRATKRETTPDFFKTLEQNMNNLLGGKPGPSKRKKNLKLF